MHGPPGTARTRCRDDRRSLLWTMALTGTFMIVEVVGGLAANSLALISDAGHMLTDVLALALSLFAVTMACRPAPARVTFGWYRLEILAALANGVLLVLISIGLGWEAWRRLVEPQPVTGPIVVVVAAIGLVANVAGLFLLRGAGRRGLNIRSAAMHVLSDALSSAAVVVCGAVVTATGWYVLDPLLSALIALVIVIGAGRLMRQAVDVLLEATPVEIDLPSVAAAIGTVDGVREVHDLHIWSITSGMTALSGHVVLETTTLEHSDRILNAIKVLLKERFQIGHSTIQVESPGYTEVGEVHP